ncbi:tyrosine-type recombinase/integrase [Martelella mediterranea]|uniref:Site-specific tyrosine recombinase XerC n=1 Tax=Martelella mediterranea DSM 17316 TaxID=1122214 RepID=A0A1U9YYN2_9HYPH|nr:site-specific integrase [Martelella mediterranea]AQZ50549.1 site-specific tyrosine recombinase XerC [Martelella mediterranea DSM 17316]
MSVRKRKWTNENGDEKTAWVVDYVDAQGKRRHKSFRLKKLADQFAATASVEVRQGIHVADSATVTIEQAGNLWLASGDAAGLERTTMDQRRQHLRLHLVPFAGNVKLSKINAPWIRALQDELRSNGRSPAMVRRVTVSLGSILADAQARGLVIRNAVHELARARSSSSASDKRAKALLRVGVDIPTNDEIRAILEAATGRYRPLLVTMIFTGIRASEARGLIWEAVDLKRSVLEVRQRADRYGEIGMPKSGAGQRAIPLPPLVVNTLREWKLACPPGAAGLVFPNGTGNVEDHQNMLKRGLWATQLAAGLTVETGQADAEGNPILAAKYSGFHALRHWYASWCINRKADGGLELTPKAVQTRMGHSSIQVTFDTYGHLFPAPDEGAELAAAEKALFAVKPE